MKSPINPKEAGVVSLLKFLERKGVTKRDGKVNSLGHYFNWDELGDG